MSRQKLAIVIDQQQAGTGGLAHVFGNRSKQGAVTPNVLHFLNNFPAGPDNCLTMGCEVQSA